MRVGDYIWYCKKIPRNDGIVEYNPPVAIKTAFNYLTVQPASGYIKTLEFGKDVKRTWSVVANYDKFIGVFNEGDVFYVDGNQPLKGENIENGQNANAIVTSVRPQNKAIYIVLQSADLRG